MRKRICAVGVVGLAALVLATAVSDDHAIATPSWICSPL
jgi:hypothetical protein